MSVGECKPLADRLSAQFQARLQATAPFGCTVRPKLSSLALPLALEVADVPVALPEHVAQPVWLLVGEDLVRELGPCGQRDPIPGSQKDALVPEVQRALPRDDEDCLFVVVVCVLGDRGRPGSSAGRTTKGSRPKEGEPRYSVRHRTPLAEG